MTLTPGQWSATRPLVTGLATAALLVAGLGAWSGMTTIAGAVVASGQVEVSENRQVVAHPDGGVVVAVLVAEGARVAEGDALMRLDGTELAAELAMVQTRILDLDARQARLLALRDKAASGDPAPGLDPSTAPDANAAALIAAEARLLSLQTEEIRHAHLQGQTRIRQIESQIRGFDAQDAAIRTEIALVEADLQTERDLQTQGLALANRISALERDLAVLRGRIGELVSARAEASGRITGIRQEVSALVTGHRQAAEVELRDVVAARLEQIARRDSLLARIARLEVHAPASGIVMDLKVTRPQAVIRAAEALLSIVPQDRPLRVILRVPVTEVDDVQTGQAVRLVFSSLPGGKVPDLSGRIALISADALTDDRSGHPFYRVEVTLDDPGFLRSRGQAIVPGMPVQAFIRTTDRSPLAYLLGPVSDYFRPAFRDG
jgi:HlyD family secretion protein